MSVTSARAPAKIPDLSLYSTTVGKKAVMAVTGLMLAGFVLFHMLGNLQIFIQRRAHERLRRLPQGHAARCSGHPRRHRAGGVDSTSSPRCS